MSKASAFALVEALRRLPDTEVRPKGVNTWWWQFEESLKGIVLNPEGQPLPDARLGYEPSTFGNQRDNLEWEGRTDDTRAGLGQNGSGRGTEPRRRTRYDRAQTILRHRISPCKYQAFPFCRGDLP